MISRQFNLITSTLYVFYAVQCLCKIEEIEFLQWLFRSWRKNPTTGFTSKLLQLYRLKLSYVETNEQALRIPQNVSDEIKSVISKLNNYSPGCDNIPPKIGNFFVDQYIELLTYLNNKSIVQGVFLHELIMAQAVPIFRAGDEHLVQNYRPISVLPFMSKIYEKVVANYLIDFLDSNNLLYKFQFGFRKSHSTSHAIITLVKQDAREAMRVVFSVLTKRICMHKPNFLRIYSNVVLKLILNCMNMQITTQLIMMYNL